MEFDLVKVKCGKCEEDLTFFFPKGNSIAVQGVPDKDLTTIKQKMNELHQRLSSIEELIDSAQNENQQQQQPQQQQQQQRFR